MKCIFWIWLLAAIMAGCNDAPRDNPADPLSPEYKISGAVQGTVLLLNRNTPIEAAAITSQTDGVTVFSNAEGCFTFDYLSLGIQTLICTKENFSPDTQYVTVTSQSKESVTFALNGAPVVLSKKIVTRKVDLYFPSPQYYAFITACISDPNDILDVDSVWFVVADSISYLLDNSSNKFIKTLSKYDVPTATIQWLVNKPLRIRSQDKRGAINLSDIFYVSRIIENTATPIYPTSVNHDTTNGLPLLLWSSPNVTFNYTYTISISHVDPGVETQVWTYTNLNLYYEELQFPSTGIGLTLLPPGTYIWYVDVVDDFGNSSRSKGASFIVR